MSYLQYFFNPIHLFSLRPPLMSQRALLLLLIICCALIVAAVISKLIAIRTKDVLRTKGFNRLFHLYLTMGIIGFVYLFFSWQGVVLLSARFWLVGWLLALIIWKFFVVKYLYIEVPKQRTAIDQRRAMQKYIP